MATKIKIYQYEKCETCRRALRYLKELQVPFEAIPIVEQPPTMAELKQMLALQGGNLKKLLNTSGQLYRQMQLGKKLERMSEKEVLALLAQHGKLVKRPFAIVGARGLLGFHQSDWDLILKPSRG